MKVIIEVDYDLVEVMKDPITNIKRILDNAKLQYEPYPNGGSLTLEPIGLNIHIAGLPQTFDFDYHKFVKERREKEKPKNKSGEK